MPIPNLKQILTTDDQQQKLDKINYNFDQLVANGGGPMGYTGSIGETGMQGVSGDQGPQGITGTQGAQGPIADEVSNFWKDGNTFSSNSLDIKTIIPVHTTGLSQSYPPSLLLGFTTDYPEYGDITGSSPIYNGQLVVNKNSSFTNLESNIRLVSDKNTAIVADIDVNVDSNNNIYNLDIGFLANASGLTYNNFDRRINYTADTFKFNDMAGNEMLSVDATVGSVFTGNFVSNGIAHFVGSIFKIDIANPMVSTPTDPAAGKVAVSTDTQGTIGFKLPEEIGATIPIGTIISLLPEIYEDVQNFVQSQDITLQNTNAAAVSTWSIKIGSGITGTPYEGWYLCNGQTWTNGTESYSVPNLNSFSYDMIDNQSTPVSIVSPSYFSINNIIGGSNVSMEMTAPSNNLPTTVQSNPDNIFIRETAGSSHVEYTIVRTPQLIFLGKDDLSFYITPIPPVPVVFRSVTINSSPDSWNLPAYSAPSSYGDPLVNELSNDRFELVGDADGIQYDLFSQVRVNDPALAPGVQAVDFSSYDLEWGKAALVKITFKADSYTTGNSNYSSSGGYSWFNDWSEFRLPTTQPQGLGAFEIGTWNDKGAYDHNETYVRGDIFYAGGNWYTLSSDLVLVEPDGTGGGRVRTIYHTPAQNQYLSTTSNITSTPAVHVSVSSWTRSIYGTSSAQITPKVWVALDHNESGPYSNFANPPGPGFGGSGYTAYVANTDDMTNLEFQGAHGAGSTGSMISSWYDNEINDQKYPAFQTGGTGDLSNYLGNYTQPFQIIMDPINNDGSNATDSIILPVVTTFNMAAAQAAYPELNLDATTDIVQYLDPHGYDEGSDWWTTVGVEYNPNSTPPWDPVEFGVSWADQMQQAQVYQTMQGGWNQNNYNQMNNGHIDRHAWREFQNDTMFRRYKTVELNVLLEPNIVDQILQYEEGNPGEKINLMPGHFRDTSPDYSPEDRPANMQPLGKRNGQLFIEQESNETL